MSASDLRARLEELWAQRCPPSSHDRETLDTAALLALEWVRDQAYAEYGDDPDLVSVEDVDDAIRELKGEG